MMMLRAFASASDAWIASTSNRALMRRNLSGMILHVPRDAEMPVTCCARPDDSRHVVQPEIQRIAVFVMALSRHVVEYPFHIVEPVAGIQRVAPKVRGDIG